jgi:outer membrane protein OmpA-like peptidoglycan-associated protein
LVLKRFSLFSGVAAMKRLLIIIATGMTILFSVCIGMLLGGTGVGVRASSVIADNLANGQKTLTLQATPHKKMFPSFETTPGSSQKPHGEFISPKIIYTVADYRKSHIEDTQEKIERQDKVPQSYTESRTKTFIYYPKSASTIHSGSYEVLDDVISHLDSNPSAIVDIRTYTDSSDDTASNLALSRQRVSDIRNYLILHGISEENITAQLEEATESTERGRTERLKSLNALVEITIR